MDIGGYVGFPTQGVSKEKYQTERKFTKLKFNNFCCLVTHTLSSLKRYLISKYQKTLALPPTPFKLSHSPQKIQFNWSKKSTFVSLATVCSPSQCQALGRKYQYSKKLLDVYDSSHEPQKTKAKTWKENFRVTEFPLGRQSLNFPLCPHVLL